MPRIGDNALLKLAPVLAALADQPTRLRDHRGASRAAAADSGSILAIPPGRCRRSREDSPGLFVLAAPMFEVTLTPTMASASQKMNVIPSRAEVRVDCRMPPGLGEEATRDRIEQVLGIGDGDGPLTIEFTERTIGNASPVESELMTFDLRAGSSRQDPGASAVPLILPGFSDSSWFRTAFPDCVAYGFFPQRHQSLLEAAPLMHNADERIDVRDLGFAAGFYRDCISDLLG